MSGSLAWVPKGPALETYETKIREDLEAALANAGLPEWETIFLKLYMIGLDEDSARPMVMVCCVHRLIRKMAETSIRESRILDRFPGFGLGSSALLLESHGLEELLTNGYQLETSQSPSSEEPGEPGTELKIYGSVPHRLGGTIRFVSTSHGEVSAVHTTTGGPIFQLDTELYQITAGHAMLFGIPDTKTQYTTSDLDECNFDGQSDFDDDIITSVGSLTSEEMSAQSSDEDSRSSQSPGEEEPAADHQTPAVQALHTKAWSDESPSSSNFEDQSFAESSDCLELKYHNRDLDYALLKLPALSDPSNSKSTSIAVPHGSKIATKFSHVGTDDTRVLVLTPDGPIQGLISTQITSYKMRGCKTFQKLLMVRLEGAFRKGYSGSAVVDSVTGAIYGQITIGTPGESLGYCLRAPDIFANILSRLGHVPVLDEGQWQVNKQIDMSNNGMTSSCGGTSMKSASQGRYSGMDGYGTFDPVERADCTPGTVRSARMTTSLHGRLRTLIDQVIMWICLVCSRFWPTTNSVNTWPNNARTRRRGSMNKTIGPSNTRRGRRLKRRKNDEDEEESSEKIQKLDTKRSSDPFACPFYLYDRHEWHNCLRNYTLNRIVDVRLHLARSHTLAPQCPVCGEEFEEDSAGKDSAGSDSAEDQFNAHVKRHTCQPLPATPKPRHGLTRHQFDAVRKVARRNRGLHTKDPAAEKWFAIWDIIFPGTPRPASPYLTEHPDVQRIRDMNDAIFSGQKWKDLTLPVRNSSPSLQNTSRNTIMTFAEDLLGMYRQIYHDRDLRDHEPTGNDKVANSTVSRSMDRSPPRHWGRMPMLAPSNPFQAIQDPLPSEHPATAAENHHQLVIQQSPGYPSSHDRLPGDTMALNSPSPSTFAHDPRFLSGGAHLGPHHQLPSCQ